MMNKLGHMVSLDRLAVASENWVFKCYLHLSLKCFTGLTRTLQVR